MPERGVFRNRWLPYLLVLPQVVITAVFFFWPAFRSLYLSFYRTDPFGLRLIYVGWRNFQQLFTSPQYHKVIVNTVIFSIGVTLLGLALSLAIAVLANQKIKGLGFYRTALLLPYGVAPPVAGIIWMFLFHPTYGLIPYSLAPYGITVNWLNSPTVAMLLVIISATWAQLGYNIAFFIAGLQLVPESLLEAATVDGASSFRRFWSITFPLLSPVTFFLAVMNLTYSLFETFGVIHSVTRGGPGDATQILVYKAYQDGFVAFNLGSSAAQSLVLMAIAILLTFVQFRFIERRVSYE